MGSCEPDERARRRAARPTLADATDGRRAAPSTPVTFGTIARMSGPAPAPTEPGTAAPTTSSTGGDEGAARRPWRGRWLTVAIGAAAVVPILVLIAVLARRTWYPTGDIAQAELRMRSLPSDPPLVGAAGRIADDLGRQGNHPGPLMFWVTWPIYWLLGRSAWAFEAATALVNAAWLCVSVWIARRRGGTPLAWWAAVILVLLVGGYAIDGVSQPWNPWTSLLPFSALLFAVWSVLDGDRWMLPVAVFAGCYALQGHIGYLALVPPLLLLAVGALAWQWWSDRRTPSGSHSAGRRGASARSPGWVLAPVGIGVLVGLVAWSGPLVDLATRTPSNVQKLYENFGNPDEPPLGLWSGLGALLRGLNPFGAWLVGGQAVSGSVVPGALLVIAWAVAAVVVWRRGERSMTRLNVVLAVALVLGLASTSRIFGDLYFYVYRWVCPLAGALVFSLGWSLVVLAPDRWRSRVDARRLAGVAAVVLVAVVALTSVRLATGPTPYRYSSRIEAQLSPQLATLPDDRRYLVRWDDPVYLGGLGFGVLLDLERRGYDVGVDPEYATGAERHRVFCPGEYDAVLTVATSPSRVGDWRARPGVREVAAADPRTAEERAASDRDRAILAAYLDEQGRPSKQADVDAALTGFVLSTKLPRSVNDAAGRLIATSVPSAVFVTDPAPQAGPVPRSPRTEACWRDR